jgi:hypothetical protein
MEPSHTATARGITFWSRVRRTRQWWTYNLKLRVFPALECDVLAEHPVTSDCVPVASLLDQNAQDAQLCVVALW